MPDWNIITGEYPPDPGGVSDYTRQVARELARCGDRVNIWTPRSAFNGSVIEDGVEVNYLPDRFGAASIALLNERFAAPRKNDVILVQYVPQAFGWKGVNLPFGIWLGKQRQHELWIMFHEVCFPIARRQSPTHNLLGMGTQLMARFAMRGVARAFVSTTAWEPNLKFGAHNGIRPQWLPIPGNIDVIRDDDKVSELRGRFAKGRSHVIGHFGTYGRWIADQLTSTVPALIKESDDRVAILLGRGGPELRSRLVRQSPDIADRIFAPGELCSEDVSLHLSACDLLIQPFVDGVTTRRTSVMAGLAHGRPVITTAGPLTESLWSTSRPVSLVDVNDQAEMLNRARHLLADDKERLRLSIAGSELYDRLFDIRHTIAVLRGLENEHTIAA